MIRRQCTREYKLEVITREQRRLLGYQPRQRIPIGAAEVLIGISADEASRMREAQSQWQINRYPLIYDFKPPMRRIDCIAWLTAHGYPVPPKSACLGCPYHSNAEWRAIKNNPTEWADVVEVDEAIRDLGGMRGQVFLHRSCKPLTQVNFSTAEERGQMNLFENECLGMCGV